MTDVDQHYMVELETFGVNRSDVTAGGFGSATGGRTGVRRGLSPLPRCIKKKASPMPSCSGGARSSGQNCNPPGAGLAGSARRKRKWE